MHLDAVLVFVSLYVHPLELLRRIQLRHNAGIYFEIVQRRCVLLADRQGALFEANVVRWAEYEDALHGGWADLAIGPGGRLT